MTRKFTDTSFIYTGNHPNGEDIDSQGLKDLYTELGIDPDGSSIHDWADGMKIMGLSEVGQSVTIKGRKVTLTHKGQGESNQNFGYWVNRTYQVEED